MPALFHTNFQFRVESGRYQDVTIQIWVFNRVYNMVTISVFLNCREISGSGTQENRPQTLDSMCRGRKLANLPMRVILPYDSES